MALTKQDIKNIVDKATVIEQINITDFFNMLLEKANGWIGKLNG